MDSLLRSDPQPWVSPRRTTPSALLRAQFSRDRVSLLRPVNVGVMADLAAERFGRSGVIHLDRPLDWDPATRQSLDYVEYAELIDQFAGVLFAAGVRPWDRVAIVKTPNYDIQALAWAVARIGAIPALLSARLDPDIINVLLDRLQPACIISDGDVARYAELTPARLRALSARGIGSFEGGVPVGDLWNLGRAVVSPRRAEEPLMITHTSSTTGISKLGETSARAVTFSALRESVFPGVHGREELFASAISHVHIRAAITQMASLSRGTPLLGIGQPDDATVLEMLVKHRPTIVEGHPNAFVAWEQLVPDPRRPFASVRIFFNTFDAIHPRTISTLLEASERQRALWLQCYGMTEVQVVTVRPYTRRSAARSGVSQSRSVGWEVPGVRARIADPDTGQRRRAQGEAGMIQVRTPARVMSFVGTPEKFFERKHGAWFDTGDWGRRGSWGQLEVLDRVADRIDGVDSCLQIEDLLLSRLPDADEVVVVPDGEGRPVPVVCMRAGAELDAETWRLASEGTGLGAPVQMSAEALKRTATVKARRYLMTELIKAGNPSRTLDLKPEIVLREGA